MRKRVALAIGLFLTSLVTTSLVTPSAFGGPPDASRINQAVERALPMLELASAGSAEHRKCFTCHSQALPIFALSEARRRGFEVDLENFNRQIEHTFKHLKRGRKAYDEGKGQGGGVDTAGYALWSLEEGEVPDQTVIDSVTSWLIERQEESGRWKCDSHRPPTEASHFTTTYLALRALSIFGSADQQDAIEEGIESAQSWLVEHKPQDTEDSVFRLLAFEYVDVDHERVAEAVAQLRSLQQDDGGWAQLTKMKSDPYATATALYALREAGDIETDDPCWTRGIEFLLNEQLDDGSWMVTSRSKPFQTYFETGFPHGENQFISTMASAWATIVLLEASQLSPQPSDAASLP